jgi:hypothetical protein
MKKERIEKAEVHRRINELFNLSDSNFVASDDRMHAYKLARPPPKVTENSLELFNMQCLS